MPAVDEFSLPDSLLPGRKNDEQKNRWDLLDWKFTEELVQVLTHGAGVYEPNNWQGLDPERVWAALLRHISALRQGEIIDPDSGLPHTGHIGTNLMYLAWFQRQKLSQ